MVITLLIFPWRFITWARLFYELETAVERRPMTRQQVIEMAWDLPAVLIGSLLIVLPALWVLYLFGFCFNNSLLCSVFSAIAPALPTVSTWSAMSSLLLAHQVATCVITFLALTMSLRWLALWRDIGWHTTEAQPRRLAVYQHFCLAVLDVPCGMMLLILTFLVYRCKRTLSRVEALHVGGFFGPVAPAPVSTGVSTAESSVDSRKHQPDTLEQSLPASLDQPLPSSPSTIATLPTDIGISTVVSEDARALANSNKGFENQSFASCFQAHAIVFVEFCETLIDLPFAFCGAVVMLTVWRAFALHASFSASNDIYQRRMWCAWHLGKLLLDLPSLCCALPVLLTLWRAPTLCTAWYEGLSKLLLWCLI
jgi:hypothetical protein